MLQCTTLEIPRCSSLQNETNYAVMMKAHLKDKEMKFCSNFKEHSEPAIVLVAEWQLIDSLLVLLMFLPSIAVSLDLATLIHY